MCRTWWTSRSRRRCDAWCGLASFLSTGQEALADLADVDLHRHAHVDLLARVWELRDNVTSYDAVYVALAEAIASPLVTCDAPLGSSPGHAARIEVIR